MYKYMWVCVVYSCKDVRWFRIARPGCTTCLMTSVCLPSLSKTQILYLSTRTRQLHLSTCRNHVWECILTSWWSRIVFRSSYRWRWPFSDHFPLSFFKILCFRWCSVCQVRQKLRPSHCSLCLQSDFVHFLYSERARKCWEVDKTHLLWAVESSVTGSILGKIFGATKFSLQIASDSEWFRNSAADAGGNWGNDDRSPLLCYRHPGHRVRRHLGSPGQETFWVPQGWKTLTDVERRRKLALLGLWQKNEPNQCIKVSVEACQCLHSATSLVCVSILRALPWC